MENAIAEIERETEASINNLENLDSLMEILEEIVPKKYVKPIMKNQTIQVDLEFENPYEAEMERLNKQIEEMEKARRDLEKKATPIITPSLYLISFFAMLRTLTLTLTLTPKLDLIGSTGR